jgi:hypothetical protein
MKVSIELDTADCTKEQLAGLAYMFGTIEPTTAEPTTPTTAEEPREPIQQRLKWKRIPQKQFNKQLLDFIEGNITVTLQQVMEETKLSYGATQQRLQRLVELGLLGKNQTYPRRYFVRDMSGLKDDTYYKLLNGQKVVLEG